MKRSKKPSRKKLVRELDKEFSLRVRGHWGPTCVFCWIKPVKHCFHFVTRAKHSLRWDRRNAVGSCAGCNFRYEFDPHFAILWFIRAYGLPAYERLVYDGNKQAKFTNAALAEMLAELVKTT